MPKTWKVYLAGEIHTDWRAEVVHGCEGLPVEFTGPVTDHAASDECGVQILGPEDEPFWKDRKGGLINSIRTRTHLREADAVVVKFGEEYRQWNAAFDAGQAAALGKPLITLHAPGLTHALKEVDAAASAVCERPEQVAAVLRYVIEQA